MIPALSLMIGCYILTRFVEIIGNESKEGGRPFLRGLALCMMLLAFLSCSVAVFSGGPIPPR